MNKIEEEGKSELSLRIGLMTQKMFEAHMDGQEKGYIRGRQETLAEVEKIIKTLKLPTDKDYRYSNEYIENWMEELKQKLGELK